MVEWHLMILSGKAPVLVKDDRCNAGWRCVADDNDKMAPSPERRDASMKFLVERGHGMPERKLVIDAELRQLTANATVSAADLARLSPSALGNIAATLRGALANATAGLLGSAGENENDEADPEDDGAVPVSVDGDEDVALLVNGPPEGLTPAD